MVAIFYVNSYKKKQYKTTDYENIKKMPDGKIKLDHEYVSSSEVDLEQFI